MIKLAAERLWCQFYETAAQLTQTENCRYLNTNWRPDSLRAIDRSWEDIVKKMLLGSDLALKSTAGSAFIFTGATNLRP